MGGTAGSKKLLRWDDVLYNKIAWYCFRVVCQVVLTLTYKTRGWYPTLESGQVGGTEPLTVACSPASLPVVDTINWNYTVQCKNNTKYFSTSDISRAKQTLGYVYIFPWWWGHSRPAHTGTMLSHNNMRESSGPSGRLELARAMRLHWVGVLQGPWSSYWPENWSSHRFLTKVPLS